MNKLYYLTISIFTLSCSSDKCLEKYATDTSCFDSLIVTDLTSFQKEIDFSERINCFEWDSLEVGERGSYKNYPCLNFHQICEKGSGTYLGKDLESHMDWFDRDRHWTFIYFYENGTLLNDVLAVPLSTYLFDELKENNESNLFRKIK
ncbi:hypothetical protein H8K90_10680 [Winogradskyella echinorum]|uniref:Lipoprotein n=1 Tax=Winogradskyella echinorum TaxID=538189 RepID=A0ABR6Y3M0_9FLAO|nr:hypothetical protein [Winogradskyella echinorum]MBC3846845.1 hypothetical protein [Winogradskyella echinorum]MBC5751193.1 hypothetical protein [Winogradskyella echinorum]